ncbi:hypothetical protein GC098_14115 [Paenibacillus sp. LMG 31458]|uniref:Uncharacterized protein n=1 Tax=Paenibacillus phytorum TaxID=2654977 RepID=A0ABX1XXM5_9BACL|nr:hypothetical protein [Paenibacillus phytorum]NOU72548.1 hypothetical protein [Paenibacillus phytorum]
MIKEKNVNAGRKTKLTKDEVREQIYLYKTEYKVSGKIKYSEMFEYHKSLYRNQISNKLVGEDFWRKDGRLGKKMIDEANLVYFQQLAPLVDNEVPNISVINIINLHFEDREKLIQNLLPLEKQIAASREKERKYQIKLNNAERIITTMKENNVDLQKQRDEMQSILFKIFRYSDNPGVPLINQLRTGNKQTEVVSNALNRIFDKPVDFYNWYDDRVLAEEESGKIVSIDNVRTEKRISSVLKQRFE